MNIEKVQNTIFTRFLHPLGNVYYSVAELVVLILIASVAVSAISEVSSRESFSNTIIKKIHQTNEEIALNSQKETAEIEAGGENLWLQLNTLTYVNSRVKNLIDIGAETKQDQLQALSLIYQEVLTGSVFDKREFDDSEITEYKNSSRIISALFFLDEIRSDHILSIAVICCSAIGALIYGLRSAQRLTIRTVTSGIATGFVVYLALKGGQHLFLVNTDSARLTTNPYSSAFAGLLAGIFSDKAYKTLSALVDNLAIQVESANRKNKQ